MALMLLARPAEPAPASPATPTFGSAEIDRLCPDAAIEEAQLRSKRKMFVMRAPPTRPALRTNLLVMAKQDQDVRQAWQPTGNTVDMADPLIVHLRQVDSANLKRLKHIVRQDGFPTAAMVGLDGVKAAWLLTLHAEGDADFIQEVLNLTTRHVRRGEVSGNDVALLTDDLLSAQGKPQRYGTNFSFRDGELKPEPMEDEANVDRRRQAAGLGTLENYACVVRANYRSSKD